MLETCSNCISWNKEYGVFGSCKKDKSYYFNNKKITHLFKENHTCGEWSQSHLYKKKIPCGTIECDICDGSGWEWAHEIDPDDFSDQTYTCRKCNGNGFIEDEVEISYHSYKGRETF